MVGKRTLMASLKRFPDSRYWFAVFIGPNGKQRCCSTKEVERRRAQKIADRFELASVWPASAGWPHGRPGR